MVPLVLILIFASIHLHDGLGSPGQPNESPLAAGVVIGGLGLAWLVFHVYALWCGRQIDRFRLFFFFLDCHDGTSLNRLSAASFGEL